MKKFIFLLQLFLILFFYSCKDSDTPNSNNFYPLAVDNYWIYEKFNIDENGNSSPTNHRDTIRVIGTENINGTNYYVLEKINGLSSSIEYRRDSLGYIVNEKGEFVYSFLDTQDDETVTYSIIVSDPYGFTFENTISNPSTTIDVSAGSFDCIEYQQRITNDVPSITWTEKFDYTYFAKDVGLIHSIQNWATSNNKLESKLIEYFVQ